MLSVVDKKSDAFRDAVNYQSKYQKADIEGRQTLPTKQLETLKSEEVDRQISRLIFLRDQSILHDEEFRSHVKAIENI